MENINTLGTVTQRINIVGNKSVKKGRGEGRAELLTVIV